MPTVGASLLVTSGGSLVGQAFCDVLEGRREGLRVVAINSDLDAPHLLRFECVDHVARLMSPGFTRQFLDVLAREQPDLILAGRDDDVVALAELAGGGRIEPGLLAGGSLALARVLRDTARTAEWAGNLGLPFAPTVALGPAHTHDALIELAASSGGPWVIKPACSQGSKHVSVVTQLDDLLAAADREGFVAQPFLLPVDVGEAVRPWSFEDQGWEADIQVVLGPDAEIRAVASFVTRMKRGRPVTTRPYVDAALEELTRLWAEALSAAGWCGPVNIQVRRSPSGAWLPFEINPRLGGGTTLRARSGFDEMGTLLRAFLGIDLPRFTSQ